MLAQLVSSFIPPLFGGGIFDMKVIGVPRIYLTAFDIEAIFTTVISIAVLDP